MRGLCLLLAICLTSAWEVNGEKLKAEHDPRDVTYWDFKEKTLHFASPRNVGINSTLVAWGLTIPDGTVGVPCSEGDECYDYGVAKVVVTNTNNCQTISWTATDLTELKDCINLLGGHWYGGGAQSTEPWPIEKNPRPEVSFVTADSLADPSHYGGVSESFWVSSLGVSVRVEDSVPLFLSLPDNDSDGVADQMCFSSKFISPFVALDNGAPLSLLYHICTADDIRQVYQSSYPKYFALPNDIPDERMLTYPVWSTWAEYFQDISDTRVIALAQMINDNGFENSQIEIDDDWETCYGEHIFDPVKFPDPKGMVDTLHSMGFRVTVWVHPFINNDCEIFSFADQNGFFIKDATGKTQLTSWWDSGYQSAGLIDFTNSDASTWWSSRLETLISETGIDGFKFDAGETSWMPQDYTLSLEKQFWPNRFTTAYANTVAKFGNMIEVRVGFFSQQQPIFVRMLDKDSYWTESNGLRTIIPSLLHSGLIGYAFVLPDMIGGNAYSGRPSTELYIRWAQANTFMPALQFSLLPWDFDDGSVSATNASLAVAALHAEFAPLIIQLARNTTLGEGPMMRPTWWLCPTEEDCLLANQQFLLGDDILVTPVVYEGATSLDVVFPPGSWKRADTGTIYDGFSKQTLNGITLDSNIYFTRV